MFERLTTCLSTSTSCNNYTCGSRTTQYVLSITTSVATTRYNQFMFRHQKLANSKISVHSKHAILIHINTTQATHVVQQIPQTHKRILETMNQSNPIMISKSTCKPNNYHIQTSLYSLLIYNQNNIYIWGKPWFVPPSGFAYGGSAFHVRKQHFLFQRCEAREPVRKTG